jgi:hypothetical protein
MKRSNEPPRPKRNKTRTLDIVPNMGEMVKPVELIEVKGGSRLTLADRRLFNILLRTAFGAGLGEKHRRFEIEVADLREPHGGNDRLIQSIEALMKTVVTVGHPDGSTDRVQLLGWNNLSHSKRRRGVLKYSIAPELAALLMNSTVFAKLEIEVLRAFTSKYALALYEAVARRVRLKHICTERFSLDGFRELLGVEDDKLTTFGHLNLYAIKPALAEVNALSDFNVTVLPEKTGRRVTGFLIGWGAKDIQGRKAAYAELQRPRVGRKARIDGAVEEMLPGFER